jgi:hypothetical protein
MPRKSICFETNSIKLLLRVCCMFLAVDSVDSGGEFGKGAFLKGLRWLWGH